MRFRSVRDKVGRSRRVRRFLFWPCKPIKEDEYRWLELVWIEQEQRQLPNGRFVWANKDFPDDGEG